MNYTCIHQKTYISSIYITFPEETSAFENMHLIYAIEMYIWISFDSGEGVSMHEA